jgi:predicted RNase H-like HicB family nuclease
MRRTHAFRAILVKDAPEDADLGVVFPELPGCTSAGDDIADATRMAHEALAGHITCMLVDGDPLPRPLPLEAPLPDWLVEDGPPLEVGRIMVTVEVAVEAVPV